MLDAAKPHLLRIVGPNCVGVLVPGIGLNASFAHTHALPGKLAFVSQSGALTTAVLDWATSKGIGFSHFISMGDSADVDFGGVINYLANDIGTSAILLYVESIRAARKFMSAARAAARNKPVLVVKAGRVAEGARAAASHTGALAGADDVYEAAIRRAGMLRVAFTDDLFNAVETLARVRSNVGDELVIMTNGGGAGVMATDALILGGGKLASLTETTVNRLRGGLPATASLDNPVDIVGDAPAERYVTALQALLDEPGAGPFSSSMPPPPSSQASKSPRLCCRLFASSHGVYSPAGWVEIVSNRHAICFMRLASLPMTPLSRRCTPFSKWSITAVIKNY